MSETPLTHPADQMCDECGKTVPKIWRVYHGHRYCSTCYAREFKNAACPQCGNVAKLPRRKPEAVCSDCEKNKPCVRCGTPPKYAIGKITEYGPVCRSCAPYFREKKPCEACGAMSNRLSRVTRLGHDLKVCPKCATADHGTCQACRKYRLLSMAPDGRMVCGKCLLLGDVPCPKCGDLMPAGCGKQCRACQRTATFRKKLNIDLAAFSTPVMGGVFASFGEWLLATVGCDKACISIHFYLPFFLDVEKTWGGVPGYPDLLKHFSAEGLRRVRLPMQWLKEAHGITPDVQMRESDSELRRIEAILASVPGGSSAGTALGKYHRMLQARLDAGDTSIRSIRLALRPAASLLLEADPGGSKLPNQAGLLRYLHVSAGQRAAVTGFVNFMNDHYGLGLTLPDAKKQAGTARRKRLEAEMLTLMQEAASNPAGDEINKRWISLGLAYFHGLPKKVGASVADSQISITDGGVWVEWQSMRYWLPFSPHVGTAH